MASTNFIDKTTVVPTAWLNEVNGTVWTLFNASSTAADGRTALGLGTISTQNSNSVNITGGTISGLSSPIPVASGGTGASTSTGTGAVVLQNNPTLNSLGVSGIFSTSASSGGDFVQFINTATGAEPAIRVDATQTTSGAALKLSNSGLNKQVSLRVNNTGGFNLYVNQTAGGGSASGQNAFLVDASGNLAFNGTVNTSGALSENGTRVFSRNSAYVSSTQLYTSTSQVMTFAHGFGQKPVLVLAYAVCNTIDNGYAVGDEIIIGSLSSAIESVTISSNTTNVYVAIAGGIPATNRTTPSTYTALTANRWDVYVRAWY